MINPCRVSGRVARGPRCPPPRPWVLRRPRKQPTPRDPTWSPAGLPFSTGRSPSVFVYSSSPSTGAIVRFANSRGHISPTDCAQDCTLRILHYLQYQQSRGIIRRTRNIGARLIIIPRCHVIFLRKHCTDEHSQATSVFQPPIITVVTLYLHGLSVAPLKRTLLGASSY